jgi:hypothetical protein
MNRKLTSTLAPAVAAALLVVLPALAAAQASEQGKMHDGMQDESSAMADCQQMTKMKEQMQAKQQKLQTELDEMVARMNAAGGTAQQQVMVDLLTKLVENRGAMMGMSMKTQPMMMGHMAQHMKSSDTRGMSDCPMMKSMQGDGGSGDPASKGAAADHH